MRAEWLVRRVPPFSRSFRQVDAHRATWAARNAEALTGDGPLWVVLGDSAAQAVGVADVDDGYVGGVRRLLQARDGVAWRVVNLSVSGAVTRDVVDRQLLAFRALGAEPDLVSAVVGGNDASRTPLDRWLADSGDLVREVPAGTLVATVARGWKEAQVVPANAHLRAAAAARGLPVADLWATTGPPYRGLYADGFHPNVKGYQQWTRALALAWGLA